MSANGVCPMKVRIIVTQHVQTDAKEFKSVVQSLTGKDSMVAVAPVGQAERGGEVGGKRPVPREVMHKAVSVESTPSVDEFLELLRE